MAGDITNSIDTWNTGFHFFISKYAFSVHFKRPRFQLAQAGLKAVVYDESISFKLDFLLSPALLESDGVQCFTIPMQFKRFVRCDNIYIRSQKLFN